MWMDNFRLLDLNLKEFMKFMVLSIIFNAIIANKLSMQKVSHRILIILVFPEIIVNEETFEAKEPLPICPNKSCNKFPVRPNILMFNDWEWLSERTD